MDDSARQIRLRIFGLVLRAFIGVLLVTILLVITITGIALANSLAIPPFSQLTIFARLEGYYVGHGSWENVHTVLETEKVGNEITLLDSNGRMLIDHGSRDTNKIGIPYQPVAGDIIINLKVKEQIIGTIVFDQRTAPSPLGAIATILAPVSIISVFLALLATVVGVLLSRQIVTPLAEVIAASRAVTLGNLNTRVKVSGPQDFRVLTDSFNQMASSLERNDRERRDLLADIAHELRTPISAMRGRLEGMLDEVYPADETHLSLALKSNYLLERLVEDLRLLTLAESRQLHFEKKDTDLKALALHSIEVFNPQAQEKNIQLQLLPTSGDFAAILDPQRTEQVIGNLLGNALRYTPVGGKVWLMLEKSHSMITLSICDNGIGIPEEDLPYIFNRFWRKDKSRARHSGGSGLGLAIAKQFVESQGGSITALNLADGGLQIQIAFPST